MSTIGSEIAILEAAAESMMAPPDRVTTEQRRSAEQILMNFRQNLTSFDIYRQILETTQNHFLMFEAAQLLSQVMLKQWHSLTEDDVIGACRYIIQFIVARQGLPSFIVAELMRSFAVIVKRASVETEILNSDFIASTIEGLIRNESEAMQTFGLQAIEAIATEFSTGWRSSHVSLSWDFNARAKKHFENVLLKNFLKLSLSTLSQLVANSDFLTQSHLKICEKFLRVALIVFSWNFSPRLASIRLRALATIIKTSSFRPPVTWIDFFQDTSIIDFFAQLHSWVRHNEDLAVSSLNCMAQLASVMGDVLGSAADDHVSGDTLGSPTSSRHADRRTHDFYVQAFATRLMELFGQLHEYEMQPMSVIVYKLFTYHPMAVFKRFPLELLGNFVVFLSQKIIDLTAPAMDAAIQQGEQLFHESLHNLYHAWRNLVRNSATFHEQVITLISQRNVVIVEAFFRSVLCAPFGTRKELVDDEIREENEDEEDDRETFLDLLIDVGYFSLFTLDTCIDFTVAVLENRIQLFRGLGTPNAPATSIEEVRRWQEDMHWIFLIVGYQFQQSSFNCISNLPEQMAQRCLVGYRSGEFTRIDFAQLIERCLENPFDAFFPTDKLDPVTKLTWYIFSWSVLEHNALASLGNISAGGDLVALISPELTRSSLWLASRLIAALSPRDDGTGGSTAETAGGDAALTPSEDAALLPHISMVATPLLTRIIEFVLKKVFTVLSKLPGEEKLCADAVQLIVFFADYRADALLHSEHLYELLAGVDLVNLPSRRPLIRSLILVGSMVSTDELRDRMYKTLLAPLEAKFSALCALNRADQSVLGQLADLYDCFTGIAEAAQSDSAQQLFTFLKPMFHASVTLVLKYPDSQLLLNAVLDFFYVATDVLFFYVDAAEECGFFHQQLLALINAYHSTQTSKFRTATSATAGTSAQQLLVGGTLDELEYQTKDLCTLMEILSHSLSKTYMPTYDGAGSVENSAKVSLNGLEIILPLMDDELLKIPTLCAAFFRLILFLTDLTPRVLAQLNEPLRNTLIHCLNLALDETYGTERLKCALEIVNNMATFFCGGGVPFDAFPGISVPPASPQPLPLIAEPIAALMPKILAISLQYGGDIEVFPEASNAMYALICLNKDRFGAYVGELLQRPANVCNIEKIQAAFLRLLPASDYDTPVDIGPREKRSFRERFEKFLVDIYGMLYL